MDILDAIKKRRSINFFDPQKEIQQSLLDELFFCDLKFITFLI